MNIFLYLIIILLISCCRNNGVDYPKYSRKIVRAYSKELENEGLILFGYGGAMMTDIKKINMSYHIDKKLTIDETRKLFVTINEEYIRRVNANEEIRPYLHNYPFTVDNLGIRISTQDKYGERVKDSNVACAFYSERTKKIFYCGYDFDTNLLVDLYEEPYEEALRIVNQDKICSK